MRISFTLLILALSSCAIAQSWELGIGINAANYQGDVVAPALFTLKETNPNLTLFARKGLRNEKLAVRLGLSFGRLTGDDVNYDTPAWRQTRRFNFKTPLTEVAATLEYQLLNWKKEDGSNRRFVPYVFGGLGACLTKPTVSFNEANAFGGANPALVAEDKRDVKNATVAFPLGAGFKIPIGRGTLGVEMGFRPTLSDYLDGISKSGNPDRGDWYALGGVHYAITLGGKAVDTDGDGITDKHDKCPNEAGVKENNGCPADTDGDGVSDARDICPQLPGNAATSGCPALNTADQAVITDAISSINFKTASAELEDASFPVLDKVADVLRRYPYYSVSLEGHTDAQGDDVANLTLSKNRAKTCYNYLMSKGVGKERLKYNGFGEAKPIASNDTEQGRRQNRRVDIVLSVNK
jgi:outer membrane protein OmpA-like peptidoglycan-associated protein